MNGGCATLSAWLVAKLSVSTNNGDVHFSDFNDHALPEAHVSTSTTILMPSMSKRDSDHRSMSGRVSRLNASISPKAPHHLSIHP